MRWQLSQPFPRPETRKMMFFPAVEHRESQCNPVTKRGGGVSCFTSTAHLSSSRRAGDPGNSEAVCPSVPNPKQDQIKCRYLPAKMDPQFFFIGFRGGLRCFLPLDSVNILPGNRDPIQQKYRGHPVIAIQVIGRDAALIDPEKMSIFPFHIRAHKLLEHPSRG